MAKGIPKSGVNKGWFRNGFRHSKDQRLRISAKLKGIKKGIRTAEHRRKLSVSLKGRKVWNKGKKGIYSEESRKKMSNSCKGKSNSPTTQFKKGQLTGERNPNWKGGITPMNVKIRMSLEYKLWRKSVFERDNYICVWCGIRSAKGIKAILHADHIKPFAHYPELRFAIDNGRTLCIDCHKTTESYLNRWIKIKHNNNE